MQKLSSDLCETTTITMATATDLLVCTNIWLEGSCLAHDFISPEFWKNNYNTMLNHYLPSSTIVIVKKQLQILAFAALADKNLAAFFVVPSCWGQGIGSVLLGHVQERLDQLHLTVYKKNIRAIDFYCKHNFLIGNERLCLHTGEKELCMNWHKNTIERSSQIMRSNQHC